MIVRLSHKIMYKKEKVYEKERQRDRETDEYVMWKNKWIIDSVIDLLLFSVR